MALSQNAETVKSPKDDSLTNKIFNLGEIFITTPKEKDISGRVTQSEMQAQNKTEVSKALDMLSGVTLTASGQRNESTLTVRGFDLRAVPVFMDGIPVYVPYDGYVDLARFTTFDLSVIDVSKGFSSMLYGPNSLGGAINLVSRQPEKKLEYDGALGMINTNGYRGNLNIGSKFSRFYFQGGYSYLHRDSYTMSGEYKQHTHENGGERENSYRTDKKINLKTGWAPTEKQEYVVGYINQQGGKGTPVYAGDDKLNPLFSKPRYWQWPAWNKETYYFLSNTKLNDKHYIKSKIYYDIFKNTINSFDDSTYRTQKKPYAFQSSYNDYTYGVNMEYGTTILTKNELKFSAQYKEDIHRENNTGEPVRRFEDNTIYFAIEDVYKINKNFVLVPGVSYSERKNIIAQDYNSKTENISDYPKVEASRSFNGQLGLFYYFKDNHSLRFSVSEKSRFATIKDRYSYRMGTAIPNPELKPETADNYDLSYSGKFMNKLSVQASVYYSHISDAILSVSNVQPGKSQMQNTGAAEFMGSELSAHYTIKKDFMVGANYSYIERHNLTNPTILFTDVPNSKIFSFIEYKPVKQIRIMLNAEYYSFRYSTSYGTKSPAFVLVHTAVSGKVWKYLSLEAGVNNLLDNNYMLVEGYPEEGRNYFLTLRFFSHD